MAKPPERPPDPSAWNPDPGPVPDGCTKPTDGPDLWVFGYGSLIWDPGFPFEEARPARLAGYHRAFCLYSMRYRGTPEKPGLVLGLDRGGACRGIAYRVAGAQIAGVMDYLWQREMLNNSYRCREVSITIATGRVKARTFVIDRAHPNYTGHLPPARIAELIAQGHGQRGSARAYLENTVKHLDALGIPDRRLHELLLLVRARGAE